MLIGIIKRKSPSSKRLHLLYKCAKKYSNNATFVICALGFLDRMRTLHMLPIFSIWITNVWI